MMGVADVLTIRRVANGWIILPGGGRDEFTHVAASPADLAAHVEAWATAQVAPARGEGGCTGGGGGGAPRAR